jgi:hypothetical protein
MWPLKFLILLVVVNNVGDSLLLHKGALVDGVLGEVGFDDVQLAEMAPTMADVAQTRLLVVMVEITIAQFRSCLVKDVRTGEKVAVLGRVEIRSLHRKV